MDNELKQKRLNEVLQDLNTASTKNSENKRNNFQHLTLLLGTILGFSVGIATVGSVTPGWLLMSSWIFEILAITLGVTYLVVDTDSQFYRAVLVAGKQVELVEAISKSNFKDIARDMFLNINEVFFDTSNAKSFKEKNYILFAKYQSKIELTFYGLFVLSMGVLVLSFLI